MSRGKRNPDTPFLSRTEVPAEKTAGEIQELLGRNKLVKRVMAEYEAGEIVGVSFTIMIQDRQVLFRLPLRWRQFVKVLEAAEKCKPRRSFKPVEVDKEQARRTAWRVTKTWLESQLALIQSGMADLQEVMLPYAVQGKDGSTLYEKLAKSGYLIEHKPEKE